MTKIMSFKPFKSLFLETVIVQIPERRANPSSIEAKRNFTLIALYMATVNVTVWLRFAVAPKFSSPIHCSSTRCFKVGERTSAKKLLMLHIFTTVLFDKMFSKKNLSACFGRAFSQNELVVQCISAHAIKVVAENDFSDFFEKRIPRLQIYQSFEARK